MAMRPSKPDTAPPDSAIEQPGRLSWAEAITYLQSTKGLSIGETVRLAEPRPYSSANQGKLSRRVGRLGENHPQRLIAVIESIQILRPVLPRAETLAWFLTARPEFGGLSPKEYVDQKPTELDRLDAICAQAVIDVEARSAA